MQCCCSLEPTSDGDCIASSIRYTSTHDMMEDSGAVGTMRCSDEEKKKLAKGSLQYNLNDSLFVKLFPDTVTKIKEIIKTI